jgi:hypothetical protein
MPNRRIRDGFQWWNEPDPARFNIHGRRAHEARQIALDWVERAPEVRQLEAEVREEELNARAQERIMDRARMDDPVPAPAPDLGLMPNHARIGRPVEAVVGGPNLAGQFINEDGPRVIDSYSRGYTDGYKQAYSIAFKEGLKSKAEDHI